MDFETGVWLAAYGVYAAALVFVLWLGLMSGRDRRWRKNRRDMKAACEQAFEAGQRVGAGLVEEIAESRAVLTPGTPVYGVFREGPRVVIAYVNIVSDDGKMRRYRNLQTGQEFERPRPDGWFPSPGAAIEQFARSRVAEFARSRGGGVGLDRASLRPLVDLVTLVAVAFEHAEGPGPED